MKGGTGSPGQREVEMAKYLLGIYSDEKAWGTFSQEDVAQAMKAWNAYTEETKASGAFIAGEGLAPTATAKTVSMRGEKKATTDGPYAETKEQFGGFYLLECKDEAEAIAWAEKIVDLQGHGAVEVRPVMEYDQA
jgi:hypothetical protein